MKTEKDYDNLQKRLNAIESEIKFSMLHAIVSEIKFPMFFLSDPCIDLENCEFAKDQDNYWEVMISSALNSAYMRAEEVGFDLESFI